MTGLVAGVDGGGTRTRVVILDAGGKSVARAEGPPGLVGPGRLEAVAGTVAEIVGEALERAGSVGRRSGAGRGEQAAGAERGGPGGHARPLALLHAGLAGAGREEVRRAVALALEALDVAETVRVSSDLAVAHHDAFRGGPGILLVAGTGSAALGRGGDGREKIAGGWGTHLGDEGGGYWIGLRGLRAVARSADGRGPHTDLTDALLDATGASGPRDLVSWCHGVSKDRIAELAPRVVRVADAGDEAAGRIVGQASRELGDHVSTLLDGLAPWADEPAVALAGGLLDPGGPLRGPVEAVLGSLGVTLRPEPVDGARGAARLALDEWQGLSL